MVDIIHKPLKEIVVIECVQLKKVEELARPLGFLVGSGQIAGLNWAEGIVFMFNIINPVTEHMSKEYMDGKIYCPSIPFVIMPEYKPTIKTTEGLIIPIIDVTLYPSLKTLALWLKKQITSTDTEESD